MAMLLLFAMAATASAVSVTRGIPDDPVVTGAEFQVSIHQTGFFVAGTVTEVLPPDGYAYVDGSAANVDSAEYDSDTRTLVLKIDASAPTVTYNVTAGTTDGTFTGTYATIDMDANAVRGDVTGESTVTIVVPALCGDVNHDGNITPADAVTALRIAVSGGYNEDADINGDGQVTSLDVLMILQKVVGAD